jgi:hypothetical protein
LRSTSDYNPTKTFDSSSHFTGGYFAMAKGGQFEMAKLGYFNMGERGQLSWVFQIVWIQHPEISF